MPDPRLAELGRLVTGRTGSRFQADWARHLHAVRAAVQGRRILVVGGAGSIGSAAVRGLLDLEPGEVLVVDSAENNLVELLREIRSGRKRPLAPVAIQPLDYGGPAMARVLHGAPPFDLVLNFAAAKHVRSERDGPSLLQMLDTNLLRADRFLGWLRRYGHGRSGVFFVSSDKAANPGNLMGASKRIMEQMLFWHASPAARGRTLAGDPAGEPLPRCTTARFANVAFSDGSLLHGFLNRIAKGQPLAGPSNIRRYFITLEEAAQVCLLAAAVPGNGEILIPRFDPGADLAGFKEIARRVLAHHGLEPLWLDSPDAARAAVPRPGAWPCCFQEETAMGEKLVEEFVGAGETVRPSALETLQVLAPGPQADPAVLGRFFRTAAGWLARPDLPLTKEDLVQAIQEVAPTLRHRAGTRSLDQDM